MKAFDYVRPATLKRAVALKAQADDQGRALAGGSDLITQMKEGRRSPSLIIDVKGIRELQQLKFSPQKGLVIGAAVPCSAIARHAAVRRHYPAIVQSCSLIGSIQIQNRAGLGGNICNAAPSADGAPPLLCLDAVAVIAGPQGLRRIPLENFFLGPGKTALEPQELLAWLELPVPPPRTGSFYVRFTPRAEMDIAIAGVGARMTLDGDGRCARARIVLAAVAPVPLRVPEAEALLEGQRLDAPALFARAGEIAASACRPISDVRSSADYRRELVKVLTRRALQGALESTRSIRSRRV